VAPLILSREMRRDVNAYLARIPNGPMKTLAEIIAFNEAHADAALKFGQTLLLESQGFDLADPATASAYEKLRAGSIEESRGIIDTVLTENGLDAIVSNSGTIQVGAQGGYPSVIVPAGYLSAGRKPTGLLFTGTAWSEARLLALAYDFEQASKAWRSPAEINPSLFRSAVLPSIS
jgi:amidase